ncbi:MAG: glycine zipper 2TM domain-containing protein [Brachymonas sp.]|nr:glycine zipper 2TM domain-containing protein [Brachymonas sp.]
MLRTRLFSIAAATAAAMTLSGCLVTPMGPGYNPYPNNAIGQPQYQQQMTPVPAPGNYYGRAQVVNVQTYQGNGTMLPPGGTGAVIGGLAGGAIGNQVAKKRDNNRTHATLAGAAVGALIGAVIEQQGFAPQANQPIYRVTVRALDNNQHYYFDYPQNPNVRIGEYVQVQGQQLYRLNY